LIEQLKWRMAGVPWLPSRPSCKRKHRRHEWRRRGGYTRFPRSAKLSWKLWMNAENTRKLWII